MKQFVCLSLFLYFSSAVKSILVEDIENSLCNDENSLNSARRKIEYHEYYTDSLNITCKILKDGGLEGWKLPLFDRHPNLIYLNYANNKIREESLLFSSNNPNLKVAVLDNAYDIPLGKFSVPSDYPSLETLFLRKNGIRQFVFTFKYKQYIDFPNLKNLYLNDNEIKFVGFEEDLIECYKLGNLDCNSDFGCLHDSLNFLNIDNNKLRNLTLLNKNGLEQVSANKNPLETLILKNLTNLYRIFLNEVSLTQISLKNLKNLKQFILRDNKLDRISSSDIYDLPELRILSLVNNSITYFDGKIVDSMSKLWTLDLTRNFLTQVPVVENAPGLNILILEKNQIETLMSEDFKAMKELLHLNLHGNNIREIKPNTLNNMEKLKYLGLKNNKLKSLPADWILPLKNLNVVDLFDNLFTNFEALSLNETVYLRKVQVNYNLKPNDPFKWILFGNDIV